MSPSRSIRLIALAGVTAFVLAACGESTAAVWTYAPAPSPTPTPPAQPSVLPTVAPSNNPNAIVVTAKDIAFDKQTILAPAGNAFQIEFHNDDAGQSHNIEIKDANGQQVFKGAIFAGVATQTYDVPALGTGDYSFACTVHASMTGTLVAGN